jgi:hypothetical protein
MSAVLARARIRWQMEASGITMGDLTFIKDGVSTTIHNNGDVTILKVILCDECEKYVTPLGGWFVRDYSGEVVMWLCAECRK